MHASQSKLIKPCTRSICQTIPMKHGQLHMTGTFMVSYIDEKIYINTIYSIPSGILL